MRIKLDQVLKGFDGNEVPDGPKDDEGGQKLLTLRKVLVNSLASLDQQASAEEQVKRFDLAMKIQNASESIDLGAEDTVLCKKRIHATYPSPLVVGQTYAIIDPPTDDQ